MSRRSLVKHGCRGKVAQDKHTPPSIHHRRLPARLSSPTGRPPLGNRSAVGAPKTTVVLQAQARLALNLCKQGSFRVYKDQDSTEN